MITSKAILNQGGNEMTPKREPWRKGVIDGNQLRGKPIEVGAAVGVLVGENEGLGEGC